MDSRIKLRLTSGKCWRRHVKSFLMHIIELYFLQKYRNLSGFLLLQGSHQKDKKKKKDKKGSKNVSVKKEIQPKKSPAPVQLLSTDEDYKLSSPNVEEDEDDKEDTSEVTTTIDVDMLNSLTGQPVPEDELLFAVPVIAPYNAIVNYK